MTDRDEYIFEPPQREGREALPVVGGVGDWIHDNLVPEKYQDKPGNNWSFDWCAYRRDQRCYFPKDLDEQGTQQAGYPVWIPVDRGHCPRHKWEEQKACPLAVPGPNSGELDAMPDQTRRYDEGGQRYSALQQREAARWDDAPEEQFGYEWGWPNPLYDPSVPDATPEQDQWVEDIVVYVNEGGPRPADLPDEQMVRVKDIVGSSQPVLSSTSDRFDGWTSDPSHHPVVLMEAPGGYVLLDGNHRVAHAKFVEPVQAVRAWVLPARRRIAAMDNDRWTKLEQGSYLSPDNKFEAVNYGDYWALMHYPPRGGDSLTDGPTLASVKDWWAKQDSREGSQQREAYADIAYDIFDEGYETVSEWVWEHEHGSLCDDVAAAVESTFGYEQVYGAFLRDDGTVEGHSWNVDSRGNIIDLTYHQFLSHHAEADAFEWRQGEREHAKYVQLTTDSMEWLDLLDEFAQQRTASTGGDNPVGNPIVGEGDPLLSALVADGTGEGLRALVEAHADKEPSYVADFLDMDVSFEQVQQSFRLMAAVTASHLHDHPDPIPVWRSGTLDHEFVSVTTKPGGHKVFGEAQAYHVDKGDVMVDVDAMVPTGTFAEDELIVRSSGLRAVDQREAVIVGEGDLGIDYCIACGVATDEESGSDYCGGCPASPAKTAALRLALAALQGVQTVMAKVWVAKTAALGGPDAGSSSDLKRTDLFWRVHDSDRPFEADDATSQPFINMTNPENHHADEGYSAVRSPVTLVGYLVTMGWISSDGGVVYDDDVIGFRGRVVGTGPDGEDLVVPEGGPVYRASFHDFVDEFENTTCPKPTQDNISFLNWKGIIEALLPMQGYDMLAWPIAESLDIDVDDVARDLWGEDYEMAMYGRRTASSGQDFSLISDDAWQVIDDLYEDFDVAGTPDRNCFAFTTALAQRLGWEQRSGFYVGAGQHEGHYWNVTPDGVLVDPTYEQFDESLPVRVLGPGDPALGEYEEAQARTAASDDLPLEWPHQGVTLYHGTTPSSAEAIRDEGFVLPDAPTGRGRDYGFGVYFTPDRSWAMSYARGAVVKATLKDGARILDLAYAQSAGLIDQHYDTYGYDFWPEFAKANGWDGVTTNGEVVTVYNTSVIEVAGGRKTAAYRQDSIPPEPGETPLPSGHVRLYHATRQSSLDSILRNGLTISNAQGTTYGEPNAVWASAGLSYWSTSARETDAVLIEFSVPFEDIVGRMDMPGSPSEGSTPQSWMAKGGNIALSFDVPTSAFLAVHEGWHGGYRFLDEYREEVKAGEYDNFLDGSTPGYAKAIERIKREGATTGPNDRWTYGDSHKFSPGHYPEGVEFTVDPKDVHESFWVLRDERDPNYGGYASPVFDNLMDQWAPGHGMDLQWAHLTFKERMERKRNGEPTSSISGEEYIEAIAQSMKSQGQKEPIVFTYQPKYHKWWLSEGNHRLAAALRHGIPLRAIRKGGPSKTAQRTAALGDVPGTVRFYHGTNRAAAESIRRDGELRAQDPEHLASQIEQEYGLAPGSVWNHPGNTFGRTRKGDADIYLTQDPQRASEYAQIGSEVLNDLLWSAADLMTGDVDQSPGSEARRWVEEYMRTHGIEPVVLTLDIPWDWLRERRNTGNWDIEEFASGDPFSYLPGPIPASFIVSEQRAASQRTAAKGDYQIVELDVSDVSTTRAVAMVLDEGDDDEERNWMLPKGQMYRLAGFLTFDDQTMTAELAYTVPEGRRKGVQRRLWEAAERLAGGTLKPHGMHSPSGEGLARSIYGDGDIEGFHSITQAEADSMAERFKRSIGAAVGFLSDDRVKQVVVQRVGQREAVRSPQTDGLPEGYWVDVKDRGAYGTFVFYLRGPDGGGPLTYGGRSWGYMDVVVSDGGMSIYLARANVHHSLQGRGVGVAMAEAGLALLAQEEFSFLDAEWGGEGDGNTDAGNGLINALQRRTQQRWGSTREAMADRSGNPEVDRLIEDFLDEPLGDWTTDTAPVRTLLDPSRAAGVCTMVTEQFVDFAKARGFKAYVTHTNLEELGYTPTGEPQGEVLDANGEITMGFYDSHCVAEVYLPGKRWPYTIDFTATQYGYSDLPKVLSSQQRTAAWSDVVAKAARIRQSGGVRIVSAPEKGSSNQDWIIADVQGDTNVYRTELMKVAGGRSTALWRCGCAWAAYSWGRSGRWKKYEGRMCSHALAVQYEAQARAGFDYSETIFDDPKPKDWGVGVEPQYEHDTGPLPDPGFI